MSSAPDIVRVAPGVVRSCNGAYASYSGTAEALAAAGVVQAHQIPEGEPGKRAVAIFDRYGNPGQSCSMQQIGAKRVTSWASVRGTLCQVDEVLDPGQAAQLRKRPPGRLRPRIGAPEPMAPVRPVRSALWPFPASYGLRL